MKRSWLIVGALAFAACSPAEIVVTAELESDEGAGEVTPVGDLQVMILPYDRDVIFDSLAQAAATPEPPIPEDLRLAQEEVAQAQREWRALEQRWNTLRDTLQTISEELEQYSRGESRYVTLFNLFEDLDAEYGDVERRMEQAFERFDSLSQATLGRAQEVQVLREQWADEAFADIGAVIEARLSASGLEVSTDTTDASGVVRVEVDPGQYWVFARYEGPYTELYWNLPVTARAGEPVQVRLTRANAEERLNL